MADNSSVGSEVLLGKFDDVFIVVQILVIIFLCINLLLIVTFLKKEFFHTSTRYVLFAVTLLSDSFLLFMSDILFLLTYFKFTMEVWLCIIISVAVILFTTVTPVTLTAMTLERYVAICMPLRHAELCSTRSTIHCILIIHSISAIPCFVILSTFFTSAFLSLYKQHRVCAVQMLIVYKWQGHLWSAVNQFYFLIMCIIIIFCYVKIMKVAKAASGEEKASIWKGLRTVIIHSFQLLLCLIGLWNPFIENAVLQIDLKLFIDVRRLNYILFYLTPKCLSPLVYGLRDETFFHSLKSIAFGLCKRNV